MKYRLSVKLSAVIEVELLTAPEIISMGNACSAKLEAISYIENSY